MEKYLVDYYNFSGVQGAVAFIDKKLTKTNIYTSNEFNPHFFNSKVLTSKKTSDSIIQNNNDASSILAGESAPSSGAGTSSGGAPASSGY